MGSFGDGVMTKGAEDAQVSSSRVVRSSSKSCPMVDGGSETAQRSVEGVSAVGGGLDSVMVGKSPIPDSS